MKKAQKISFLSVATLAGMYAYNQFVASTSTKRICSQPKTDPIIPGNREMFLHKNWNRRSCSSYS